MPGAQSWPRPPRLPIPLGACPWNVMAPCAQAPLAWGAQGSWTPAPLTPRLCSPSLGSPARLGHGSERSLLMTPRGSRHYRQTGATWKIKLGE